MDFRPDDTVSDQYVGREEGVADQKNLVRRARSHCSRLLETQGERLRNWRVSRSRRKSQKLDMDWIHPWIAIFVKVIFPLDPKSGNVHPSDNLPLSFPLPSFPFCPFPL